MARNFLKLAATAALAAMMAASATAQSLIRDAEIEEKFDANKSFFDFD